MAQLIWFKDITPSNALRRWYHQAPEIRFTEFTARYLQELQGTSQQLALAQLHVWAQNGDILLLTAVKNPLHSHVSVLLGYLGWQAQTV